MSEKNVFFLLPWAYCHLNEALRKWHSTGENTPANHLFSPCVWPLSLLFTSCKTSKPPCLFLSDTENNIYPSSLYPGSQSEYQWPIHRMPQMKKKKIPKSNLCFWNWIKFQWLHLVELKIISFFQNIIALLNIISRMRKHRYYC